MASDEVDTQPGEPNWDLYQADLKVSRMVIKRPRPNVNFQIDVLPQPPRYRPSSGPQPEPVDLSLVDDSNAFIVDKVILPLEPFTELGDPRQRRAYYIIGWPDLPAARPVVDCAKALDYVSPYAVEQWEYEDFLRRETESEQAETEAALAAVAQAIAAEKGKNVAGTNIPPHSKKKPGRKPKKARFQYARPPTPQLDSEQEELLAKRKQGPSLSTPQKSRIAQLDAEMEMDEDVASDEEIQRQLVSESLRESADSIGEEKGASYLPKDGTAAPVVASSPRPSSARHAAGEGVLPPSRGNFPPGAFQSSRASPLPSSVQQPKPLGPTGPTHPLQRLKPISTTPIPLPPLPGLGSRSKVALSLDRQSVVSSSEMRAPLAQGRAPSIQLTPAVHNSDPVVARAPSSSNPSHASNGPRGGFTPTNSFTPAGEYLPRPSKRPADESPFAGDSQEGALSNGKVKKERKKKAPKLLEPPAESAADPSDEPQAEQEYVVKRLEGDSIVDGTHYFKVRWAGDWPPEQNPTWEPRENISAKLVKAYLKRKAGKAQNSKTTGNSGTSNATGKSKEKHQSTLKQWASKLAYSSVSEAFEGQAELDQSNGRTHDDSGGENDHELSEEFLVVDKRKATERRRAAADIRKSLSSQDAAKFANLEPGRSSGFDSSI